MSDQLTSQSRSDKSVISRRTALRGAAWSASAVTVVVAAPAHANTSPVSPPTGTASGSVTRSSGNGAVFTFNTSFKNTGTTTIQTVTCVISWNGFSHSVTGGPVVAGGTVSLPASSPAISFPNNAQGETVTLTYYAGAAGSTPIATLTFPNVHKGTTVIGR